MSLSDSTPVVENDKGRLEIVPGNDVPALSWGSWNFRWTPAFDVQAGGGMEILLVPRFPTNRWSLPQKDDPTAPGYVTVASGAREDSPILSLEMVRWPALQKAHGATLHIIQVSVGGRTMKPVEWIQVVYGDQRGGSLGTRSQLSAREVAFPVFVSDGHGPRFLERLPSWNRHTDVATLREQADFNPTLRVVGGRAAGFHVAAPMEVDPSQPFDLRIAALDQGANAATDYQGVLDVSSTDEKSPRLHDIEMSASKQKISGVMLHSPGFHRIYVVDPDRELLGVSNPVRVMKRAHSEISSLYWGELHGHSELSDGNGNPDEHYTYARDTALLDFACVCDHDVHLSDFPDRWKTAAEKVKEYSRDNDFVAILGYEARIRSPDSDDAFGDINVYYRGEEGNMLPPFHPPLDPGIAGDEEVILIPHTTLYGPPCNMGTHWDQLAQMNQEIMPLVEVFSTHGNSEYYDCPRHVLWQGEGRGVLEALKKGFRLGMIGSSDYHEVLTGSLLRIQDQPRTVNNRHMQARCGLAVVRAEGLNREELFLALRARAVYATSGIRAYLDFSVNDCDMGGEFTLSHPGETRRIVLAAAAPERIVKLEIIRNGEIMADLADGRWYAEKEWEDGDVLTAPTFYYLRMTTERTDFAWSSPVWVDFPGAKA